MLAVRPCSPQVPCQPFPPAASGLQESLHRAQYANLVGILGRVGKHGLNSLYVEDVRQFYVKEDLPVGYKRRELAYYSVEANSYIDRMTHHIGFEIVRPYPEDDQDGRDVEPVIAKVDSCHSMI